MWLCLDLCKTVSLLTLESVQHVCWRGLSQLVAGRLWCCQTLHGADNGPVKNTWTVFRYWLVVMICSLSWGTACPGGCIPHSSGLVCCQQRRQIVGMLQKPGWSWVQLGLVGQKDALQATLRVMCCILPGSSLWRGKSPAPHPPLTSLSALLDSPETHLHHLK